MDDAWIRANLNGNEDFFSVTPSMMHLKMVSVDTALKGHVAAIGDLQRGLLPVTSEPRRNRERSVDRATSRGRAGTRLHLGICVSFPGLKGAPRAWDTYSANVLTNSMQIKQSQYDGCLFYRLEPSRERIEEKAGRHIDDFLVTGPQPNVERFLEQTRCSALVQNRRRRWTFGD